MESGEGLNSSEPRGQYLRPAQIKILNLMLQEKSPNQIAESLGIKPKTVYTQRTRIYSFFKTRDLTAITQKTLEMKLLPPPELTTEAQK